MPPTVPPLSTVPQLATSSTAPPARTPQPAPPERPPRRADRRRPGQGQDRDELTRTGEAALPHLRAGPSQPAPPALPAQHRGPPPTPTSWPYRRQPWPGRNDSDARPAPERADSPSTAPPSPALDGSHRPRPSVPTRALPERSPGCEQSCPSGQPAELGWKDRAPSGSHLESARPRPGFQAPCLDLILDGRRTGLRPAGLSVYLRRPGGAGDLAQEGRPRTVARSRSSVSASPPTRAGQVELQEAAAGRGWRSRAGGQWGWPTGRRPPAAISRAAPPPGT